MILHMLLLRPGAEELLSTFHAKVFQSGFGS
jgi:hypothetical protein